MSENGKGSDTNATRVVTNQTPTADALRSLRDKVLSRPTPGPIKKTAQEVGMTRSDLSRMIAPGMIEKVADAERHLTSKVSKPE